MKLNLNSKTSKLYKWFYTTQTMPESLCPYFWKLVLMWILIIPYTILSLPIILMDLKDPWHRTTGERAGCGALIWFAVVLVLLMLFSISAFWYTFPKNSFGMHVQALGIVLWLIAICIGSFHGIKYIKESKIKYDENGYRIWNPEPKQDSILVSFVKASYNKYCPKIEWTKNDNK